MISSAGVRLIITKVANIFSVENLCVVPNENITITMTSDYALSALVKNIVATGLTSAYALSALVERITPAGLTSAYLLNNVSSPSPIAQPISTYTLSMVLSDDFNDNIKGAQWDETEWGATTVNEAGQQLQVAVVQLNGGAGYVTVIAHNLTNSDLAIDIITNVASAGMCLYVCLTKVIGDTPYNQNDWYRIMKWYQTTYSVQRRVAGGATFPALASGATIATGSLRITISGGTISFYDNGVLVYSEAYALGSYICYIYLEATSGSNPSGTDAFDNFIGQLTVS